VTALRFGVPFSNEVRDNLIAPHMSDFTEAKIPEKPTSTPDQEQWVANYYVRTIFLSNGVNLTHEGRAHIYGFLRCAVAAFDVYGRARALTLKYLQDTGHELVYISAISYWERFVADAWQAVRFLAQGKNPFVQGDDSIIERVNTLHNDVKHFYDRINSGKVPLAAPLPIWLTNDGLESTRAKVSFAEMAELLEDIRKYADVLQSPGTMREGLEAIIAAEAEPESDASANE
jgi:hypothetical protein